MRPKARENQLLYSKAGKNLPAKKTPAGETPGRCLHYITVVFLFKRLVKIY